MHIDYATESLAKKLDSCYLIDEQKGFPVTEDGKWKLSNHCPVIADLTFKI
jgi:exonuclease III